MSSVKEIIKQKCPAVFLLAKNTKSMCIYNARKYTPKVCYESRVNAIFRKNMGYDCNFRHPKKYSEKIQWLKLHDSDPRRTMLTDKAAVREWVAEKIGEEYLMPLIGVYDRAEDIDFDSLPDRFVIKTNHSSGWNIIVKDKSKADLGTIRKRLNKWLKLNFAFWDAFEMHYSPIVPKIVIEEFVEDRKGELNDFKFLCFGGEVRYFWVDFDRYSGHTRNIYDLDCNLQPWNQGPYKNYHGTFEKPKNFDEMLRIAKILCEDFNHVRVDLYNVDGKIYFGEMTFTNGSGMEGIFPEKYEYMLGDLIKLPTDEG